MDLFNIVSKDRNSKYLVSNNQVLLTFDNGVVMQAINLMMSIQKYNPNVSFICICQNLSNDNVAEILRMETENIGILLYQIDIDFVLPSNRWVSATILRVFSPWLIDENIDEVLYLDCDIICKGNLDNLFDYKDYLICMAYEISANTDLNNVLGGLKAYCNAGVCKLNLSRLRNEYEFQEIRSEFLGNLSKYPTFDQDFLNSYFSDKITIISAQVYNFQPYEFHNSFYYYRSLSCAKLIHFTVGKPWDRVTPLYLFEIYRKYTLYKPMKDLVDHEYKRRKQLNFLYWLRRKIKHLNVD